MSSPTIDHQRTKNLNFKNNISRRKSRLPGAGASVSNSTSGHQTTLSSQLFSNFSFSSYDGQRRELGASNEVLAERGSGSSATGCDSGSHSEMAVLTEKDGFTQQKVNAVGLGRPLPPNQTGNFHVEPMPVNKAKCASSSIDYRASNSVQTLVGCSSVSAEVPHKKSLPSTKGKTIPGTGAMPMNSIVTSCVAVRSVPSPLRDELVSKGLAHVPGGTSYQQASEGAGSSSCPVKEIKSSGHQFLSEPSETKNEETAEGPPKKWRRIQTYDSDDEEDDEDRHQCSSLKIMKIALEDAIKEDYIAKGNFDSFSYECQPPTLRQTLKTRGNIRLPEIADDINITENNTVEDMEVVEDEEEHEEEEEEQEVQLLTHIITIPPSPPSPPCEIWTEAELKWYSYMHNRNISHDPVLTSDITHQIIRHLVS